jgi:hypothetical protein
VIAGPGRNLSYTTDFTKYIIPCVIPNRAWEALRKIHSGRPADVDTQLKYCLWCHVTRPSLCHAVRACLKAAISVGFLT